MTPMVKTLAKGMREGMLRCAISPWRYLARGQGRGGHGSPGEEML
jgi:hypothetical protein